MSHTLDCRLNERTNERTTSISLPLEQWRELYQRQFGGTIENFTSIYQVTGSVSSEYRWREAFVFRSQTWENARLLQVTPMLAGTSSVLAYAVNDQYCVLTYEASDAVR